ncbi:MAG: hypothetical protein FJ100_05550 [Deltaproteobacteria bacterium]|nr:hypothetical protein [Deltaproteobacteria bacterium]
MAACVLVLVACEEAAAPDGSAGAGDAASAVGDTSVGGDPDATGATGADSGDVAALPDLAETKLAPAPPAVRARTTPSATLGCASSVPTPKSSA